MENPLTTEDLDRICSNLRAIDFMKRHQAEMDRLPELKQEFEKLSSLTRQLIDQLSEDQRNRVLEIHKVQADALAKALKKEEKKK
jgi:hypothetical protein